MTRLYLSFDDEEKEVIGPFTVTFKLDPDKLEKNEDKTANEKKQDKCENHDAGK